MAMHGRSRIKQEWFCCGCNKMHSNSQRDIEGVNQSGYWCAASIKKAIKERRNDIPPHDLTHVPRARAA